MAAVGERGRGGRRPTDQTQRPSREDLSAIIQNVQRQPQIQRKPVSHPQSAASPTDDQYGARMLDSPSSPVKIRVPSFDIQEPSSADIETGSIRSRASVARKPVGGSQRPGTHGRQDSQSSIRKVAEEDTMEDGTARRPFAQRQHSLPIRDVTQQPAVHQQQYAENGVAPLPHITAQDPLMPSIQFDNVDAEVDQIEALPQLQYHHKVSEEAEEKAKQRMSQSTTVTLQSSSSGSHDPTSEGKKSPPPPQPGSHRSMLKTLSRPSSSHSLGSDLHARGRSLTPQDMRMSSTLSLNDRGPSSSSAARSPDRRPVSTMDVLNISHAQQMAQQSLTIDNARLRGVVGENASLLDTKKTLDMYRANVKKTNDSAVQYEFAILLVTIAQQLAAQEAADLLNGMSSLTEKRKGPSESSELLKEARNILQRLSDKNYIYAQYYLADGYASGLFSNGKEEYDRAFPLFISAGKHGHAESAYRAALCYEFGWGCRRDYAKAAQWHRQAASKAHPGAATRLGKACLTGDMGLGVRYREGVKWMKRASEYADTQHNSAVYELGLMHLTGYGDDIFKDEAYAAQLFTKAAELGHAEASLRMGEAYEHGLLTCPQDPALSIHFYNAAAQAGLPRAMMALCAWYMVGAEPVLEKDEREAYEWAKQAAETGFPKAEYAIGYFTEMGIGCRRDPLEANVWYVRAADQGDDRAKQRLAIIRAAETGDLQVPDANGKGGKGLKKRKSMLKGGADDGNDKDCVVM